MVQLVGSVTAVQVKLTTPANGATVEEEAVAPSPDGAEGTAVQLLVVPVRGSGTATIGNETDPLANPGAVAVTVTVPAVNWLRRATLVIPPSTANSGSPGAM
jgi:hypothetical protein